MVCSAPWTPSQSTQAIGPRLTVVGRVLVVRRRADTVRVDPTWRSDASGEDERGHAARRGPSSPDATGPAAVNIARRPQPTLDLIADTAAPHSSVRFASRESRAPPALLAQVSR